MRKGLGYHNRRSPFGFNPGTLFAGGAAGAWYDPSDASTLFEDTAGTTPSPTPGAGALSVVGLMLDKSQNGVGTNGAYRYNLLTYTEQFDNAAWVLGNFNTFGSGSVANTTATLDPVGGNTADFIQENTSNAVHFCQQLLPLTSGVSYSGSFYVKPAGRLWVHIGEAATSNGVYFDIQNGVVGSASAGYVGSIQNAGNGWYQCRVAFASSAGAGGGFFIATAISNGNRTYTGDGTSGIYVWGAQLTTASAPTTYQRITADWYSTMAGNHAISYNTTTARPELSARVNLLTYSEQFDNGVWSRNQTSVNPNTSATTDPLGGNTADEIVTTASTGNRFVLQTSVTVASASYTYSVYLKANTAFNVNVRALATNDLNVNFNLSTGVAGAGGTMTPVGNGWYRCVVTGTLTAGSASLYIYINDAAASVSIFAWGADLRPANIGTSVPAYQRIADQYTYDSSGFPRYLVFNGTASGMHTPNNLNLSATDKATVFAGVRKQSDATAAVLTELSANFGSNNGALAVFAPSANTTADYYFGVTNTTTGKYAPTTYTAPISNVLSCAYDLSSSVLATQVVPKINGSLAQVNPSAGAASTGNYGTYPLYIGSRNNGSLWFNGNIYSLIVVGAASTAAQISSTESWINVKEGTVY